jgi:glycosyltransferase involved in cell wall biosynthesis
MKELHCGAYAYIHGNEVGGTNPALLKAMGYGNYVLAYNVPFNAEVVGSAAVLYEKSVEDLRRKLQFIVDHPDEASRYRQKAVARIKEAYAWDKIAEDYERMFNNIISGYYKKGRGSD